MRIGARGRGPGRMGGRVLPRLTGESGRSFQRSWRSRWLRGGRLTALDGSLGWAAPYQRLSLSFFFCVVFV